MLQAKKIKPRLPLEKDLELTDQGMSYDSAAATRSVISIRDNPIGRSVPATDSNSPGQSKPAQARWPVLTNGAPDFANMNSQQRRAYDLNRLSHKFA